MKTGKNVCVAAASMSVPLNTTPGAEPDVIIIQYMPAGPQKISPFVNGEPMDMAINVTSEYADVFQVANQALLAQASAGTGDEPYTDFGHTDEAASSRPRRYFWDAKKGVLLETKLTASGKSAIQGGDYSRFSPQWVFDKTTFKPIGLPVNQGAFVNRAAFQNIANLPVVSASRAVSEWAQGSGAAGEPTPADKAAAEAQNHSVVAYQIGKIAYSTAENHKHAAMLHRKAADGHNNAADLYDREANMNRAQAERTLANVHLEQADRHDTFDGQNVKVPVSDGGGSEGIDFLAQAMARSVGRGIDLVQASHSLSREQPQLYKSYLARFRGPHNAQPSEKHEFIRQAESVASARGCDLEAAKVIVCRSDYGLYRDYVNSNHATAKASRSQVASGKLQELANAVGELKASGKSYLEAVQIVSFRRPDLAEAYRDSLVK